MLNISLKYRYVLIFLLLYSILVVLISFGSYFLNNSICMMNIRIDELKPNEGVMYGGELVKKKNKFIFDLWAIDPNQEFKCNNSKVLLKKLDNTSKGEDEQFLFIKTYQTKRANILKSLYEKTGDEKFKLKEYPFNHYLFSGVNASVKKERLKEGRYSVYILFDNCSYRSLLPTGLEFSVVN